jgi:iron complex outermembrane receptor protein
MILNNGIRLEGQQWGTEHAPEIDPFIAKEITVVKGAETVRFGPEAMGGVILINPEPIPTKAGQSGELDLIGASNGRMVNASVTVSGGSKKWQGLGYRIQSSSKIAGNVQSPEYYQDNTGVRELNFSGALGYSSSKLGTELYLSHFKTSLGILSDAHTGNLSDLNGIIENGRPFRSSDFTYQMGNPKQEVDHQLVKFKSHYHLNDGGKLNLQYGFQRNHRREFDRRRGELNERASLDLQLFTNTLDLSYTHMTRKKWNGSVGLNLIQQANSNIPGTGVVPLIPNYDMKNAGIFIIEKYTSGPLEIEGGLRYDYRQVESARIQNGELEERTFQFQNFSAFMGGVYALSRTLTFNTNIGTAWRPPNINEQFSQGLHHGVAAIEIGNQDFVSEQSYKWVNTLSFVDNNFRFELTGFANRINNYIYLSPSEDQFVSLRGSFAVFEYLQTNANLWGADISANYTLTPSLELYTKGSIVRAKNISQNNFLPFIPSDRLETGLVFNLSKYNNSSDTKFSLGNLMVAEQTRAPDFDLAPPPSGYFLWNAAFQTSFKISENKLNLGFQIKNIFNTSYKDYMNRFRYFTHDMGRNILLKLNYEF